MFDVFTFWRFDPPVIIGLAVAAAWYALGIGALWHRAGRGQGIRVWQVAAYYGGLATLMMALFSPLAGISEELLSAHMVQHILLVIIAAPLIVLGVPNLAFLWALRAGTRSRPSRGWSGLARLEPAWNAVTFPPLVWLVHVATLLVWHMPALFQWALQDEWLHALEHVAFLGTAILFWWTLLHPLGRARLSYGAGILYLFGISLITGGLGTIMTFSQQAWYPWYSGQVAPWPTTLLNDQQVAGSIMWIVGGTIYVVAAAVLFSLWLQGVEREMSKKESARFSPTALKK